MTNSFDVDIATEYGLVEAILLNIIAFWVKQNTLNDQNKYEGRYWTYNTFKALKGLLPYLSESSLKRAIKNLQDADMILVGNFNNDKFTHTNYYTLTDRAIDRLGVNYRKCQNDTIEGGNLTPSIFNKNTDIAVVNNSVVNKPSYSLEKSEIDEMFKQFWEAYPACKRKVNKKGCRSLFGRIENIKQIFPDIISSLEVWKASTDWKKQNGQFIPAPHKWLNQEYWTVSDARTETQIKIDEVVKQNSNDFLL